MSRLRAGAVSVGLFAFAFAIRSIPAPRVFDGDRVNFVEPDAYYHLRRVLFTLERFPEVLSFDRYINHPHGGQPIWPPLFDLLLAGLAWPVHTGVDPASAARVEAWLAWVPPLLGAATVVVLYAVVRRVAGGAAALASGAILALLSGHYWYSQVGFLDHHAAHALVSTAALSVGVAWLGGNGDRPGWRLTAALGVVLAALLLVWPGALLHVLVLEGALVAFFATRESREDARRLATASALANALAFLLVAPFSLGTEWAIWSDFSPAVLSRFQPWLFGALALHAAACQAAWRSGFGETRRARLLETSAIGAAVLLLSVSFFPGLVAGAFEAWRWLFKQELFQAAVAESRPLFAGADGFDPSVAEARLSRFVYLVPLAWAALRVWTRSSLSRRAVWLLGAQTAVLAAATLVQRRFFDTFSVMVALSMGWTLVLLWRRLADRSRPGASLAVALLALFLLWPVLASYRLPLRNVVEALRAQPLTLPEAVQRQRRFADAAVWLRENSPPTAGFLDPGAEPEYGVLAFWTHGHLIEYVARRPSVADNFGDDVGETGFLASHRYFQAPPGEAAELARALRVRYVLTRSYEGAERAELAPDSMQLLLSGTPDELRGLAGLRLVYDEPLRSRDRGRVRIFEVLP